jgi:DNA-binding XRE family transcriptional regulator
MEGRELTAWRKTNDISQDELANALGVNRQTVLGWEKCERVSSLVEIAIKAIDGGIVDLVPHLKKAPGRPRKTVNTASV